MSGSVPPVTPAPPGGEDNDRTAVDQAPPMVVPPRDDLCCARCKFSSVLALQRGNLVCRRYPPVTTHFPIGPGQWTTYANWPIVRPDAVCGEFVLRLDG